MSLLKKLSQKTMSTADVEVDTQSITIIRELTTMRQLASEQLRSQLLAQPKYNQPQALAPFGFKAYSQYTEDGILDEIFRRIGETDRTFVEFGVGNGLENNTMYRLACGWRGVWFDGDKESCETISKSHAELIDSSRLSLQQKWLTSSTVEQEFTAAKISHEFDLLSIDIDGNDFWVWQAISNFSPRVIVIEYNAGLGPTVDWKMPNGMEHASNCKRSFGASLKAFELLGRQKGYALVACELSGVNAFFVRTDLLHHFFIGPYTSEFHFEPPRYFLIPSPGHPVHLNELLALSEGKPQGPHGLSNK